MVGSAPRSAGMRDYESISEVAGQGVPNGQAREEGVPNGQGTRMEHDERTALRSSGGRRQSCGSSQCRKIAFASSLALILIAGPLNLYGRYLHKKDQRDDLAAADLHSKHKHQHRYSGVSVSVFESSLHTGARLDQGFPSPAGLKNYCTAPRSGDDHKDSGDSSDDSSSGGSFDGSQSKDQNGPAVCSSRGPGTVVVESDKKLQTVIGFGGAFTDAATINFFKLPPQVQDKVMDAYFGPNGIEYTVGRIPMGSCDFSVETYSFDDVPGDYNLTSFDIQKDTVQKIPMILEALKRQKGLQLFTSPWSPPAWMKNPKNGTQSMIESDNPEGLLADSRVHAAWALFFSKFISAYAKMGINLWGLTVQSDSLNDGPWEACTYTPSSQASFIRDYLGPLMHRDHPDVKIIAYDHNKDFLVEWAKEMMLDKKTSKYVDGIGFHWYSDGWERLLDGSLGWSALNETHNLLGKDKFILSTEGCNCPNVEHSLDGGWKRAEHTAHDIITDMNSWSTGWVDLNLMLDHDGGPKHIGSKCDSPVICNENHTDVIFQPMFYTMGHISKFAKTGARRLKTHVTGSYQKGGMGPSSTVPGYEATVYGCEGSVRQSWDFSVDGKIALADYYSAQYDWFSAMCLSGNLTESYQSVSLVSCDSDEAGIYTHDPASGQLSLQLNTTEPPLCLDVLGRSVEDGAVLTLVPCVEKKEDGGLGSQEWGFYAVEGGAGEGSLVSVATEQCVTAGWPFFTGVAFEMSKESKKRYTKDFAVVLLNEAEEPVDFDLSFPSKGFTVRATIGGRSMQTILA